ncbi:hypothetical protein N2152v2_008513 [Parachlorella kessleri]
MGARWLSVACTTVVLLVASVGAAKPELSSVKCNEDNWWFSVCHLTSVTLWKGQLYYVSTNTSFELPEARLNERSFDPRVKEVISVITPEALQAKLLAEGAQPDQAVRHEQGYLFSPWVLANYWHTTDDTAQLYLRFCQHLGLCAYDPSRVKSTALLAYHNMDMPENFGLGVRQLYGCFASTLYQVAPFPPHGPGTPPRALRLPPATAGLGTEHKDLIGDDVPLVVFARVMLGVGKQAIPLHGPQYGLEVASDKDKLGRISYMRTCAGLGPLPDPLPAQPAASIQLPQTVLDGNGSSSDGADGNSNTGESMGRRRHTRAGKRSVHQRQRARPHVVLVNRRFTAGRSIVRLDEAYFMLQQQGVSVSLAFVEGTSLAAQAAVFSRADILVVPHGAATGNLYFLPRHAVIIQVSSFVVHLNHDNSIAKGIPSPFFNITYKSIYSTDVDFVEPIMSKVRRNPGFQRLPPAMQAAALVNGTNLSLISHVDFVANTPGFQTVDFPGLWKDPHEATYYLNYNVPPERLVAEVLEGIQLWKQKTVGAGLSVADNLERSHQQEQQAAKGEQQLPQAREVHPQQAKQQQHHEQQKQEQQQEHQQQPLVLGGGEARLLRGEGTSQGPAATEGDAGMSYHTLTSPGAATSLADRNQ